MRGGLITSKNPRGLQPASFRRGETCVYVRDWIKDAPYKFPRNFHNLSVMTSCRPVLFTPQPTTQCSPAFAWRTPCTRDRAFTTLRNNPTRVGIEMTRMRRRSRVTKRRLLNWRIGPRIATTMARELEFLAGNATCLFCAHTMT